MRLSSLRSSVSCRARVVHSGWWLAVLLTAACGAKTESPAEGDAALAEDTAAGTDALAQDGQTTDVQAGDAQANDVQAGDAKPDDAQKDDAHQDDAQNDDAQTSDVATSDQQATDTLTADVPQDDAQDLDAATDAQTAADAENDALTGGDAATGNDAAADADDDAAALAPGQVAVYVVDPAGKPVAGAFCAAKNGAQAKTDATGHATLEPGAVSPVHVTVTANGFADTVATVGLQDGQTVDLTVHLTKYTTVTKFLGSDGATIQAAGAQIDVPPGALMQVFGLEEPYTGTITAYVAPIAPTAQGLAGAPGTLVGTPAGQITASPLSPLFLAEVSFYTATGDKLQLLPGLHATMTITIAPDQAEQYAMGESVGIWSCYVPTGEWTQETKAVVTDDGMGGKMLEVQVPHFTWWMAANPVVASACVNVTVTSGGKPVPGAVVAGFGLTDATYSMNSAGNDGQVCLPAKPGASYEIVASAQGQSQQGGVQTITVTNTSAQCGLGAGCQEVSVVLAPPQYCGGSPALCDDGTPCTVDSCDPVTKKCVHDWANGTACDDGSSCTTSDACFLGACVGTPTICNDGNPCTADACVNIAGCVSAPNPKACSDGVACTIDSCDPVKGCSHAPDPVACDDANVCTDDACSAQNGCAHTANTAACDDGNPCTSGEYCVNAACQTLSEKVDPQSDQELVNDYADPWGVSQNIDWWQMLAVNQKLANGRLKQVELSAGSCGDVATAGALQFELFEQTAGHIAYSSKFPLAALPVNCAPGPLDPNVQSPVVLKFDGQGAPLKAGLTYWLVLRRVDGPCNPAGTGCDGKVYFGTCGQNMQCYQKGELYRADDGLLPPFSTKARLTFRTKIVDNLDVLVDGNKCDDGLPCSTADVCAGGVCKGTASCDDGIACTTDACTATGCLFTPQDSVCSDNDPCTNIDTCDVTKGCVYSEFFPDGVECTDGNPCTVSGSCLGGKCQLVDKDCEDGDLCTVNYCYRPGGTGSCASDSKNCDDGNDCTADFCTNNQCAPQPVPDKFQCTDGLACNTYSQCFSGKCTPVSPYSTCVIGTPCEVDAGCASHSCIAGKCAFNSCYDGLLSGDETDLDCGGSCAVKCMAGQKCKVQEDCDQGAINKYCSASQGYICWFTP